MEFKLNLFFVFPFWSHLCSRQVLYDSNEEKETRTHPQLLLNTRYTAQHHEIVFAHTKHTKLEIGNELLVPKQEKK